MSMFCEHGNAYVIPNAYNKYVEDTSSCIHRGKKSRDMCQKCCMVITSSRIR